MWRADRRYWLDSRGRAVAEGHPDAQELLFAAGVSYPDELAARYGLLDAAKSMAAPEHNKAISGPRGNKRAERRSDEP